MEIKQADGELAKKSKYMIRKTFIVSKNVVLKKYGTVSLDSYTSIHKNFCTYFGCIENNV